MSKPKIAFITQNSHKEAEYRAIMGLYGLKISIIPEFPESLDEYDYVISERMSLTDSAGATILKYDELKLATCSSHMIVYPKNKQHPSTYHNEVKGYIDPFRPHKEEGSGYFGFDDCFILASTNISYRESAVLGLKNTPRNSVIASFINEHIKRPNMKTHGHIETKLTDTITFGDSVYKFIKDNTFIKAIESRNDEQSKLFMSMLSNIIEEGVFFRSALTSREGNYWFPGLNGGLPVVQKKDEIHELTFMMHDMMHHLMPDLVFDGTADTGTDRKLYILYRMMGEAVSMVLADYVFVDMIKDIDASYDYKKRHIFPVFDYIMHNVLDKNMSYAEKIKHLCLLNTLYALTGKPLPAPDELRIPYEEKYTKYFIEDYRWTAQNLNNMVNINKQTGYLSAWSKRLDYIANNNMTINDFSYEMSYINHCGTLQELVEYIFNAVWNGQIETKFQSKTLSDLEENDFYASFHRYMSGQSVLFFKYQHIAGFEEVGNVILKALKAKQSKEAIIELYNFYVDRLYKSNVISQADADTFKIVCPVFPPFFVYYDSKSRSINTIEDMAKSLGMND